MIVFKELTSRQVPGTRYLILDYLQVPVPTYFISRYSIGEFLYCKSKINVDTVEYISVLLTG
jgi:hypothetical protein